MSTRPATPEPKSVDDLFPRPWLMAGDLQRPVTVTIAGAEMVDVYDKLTRTSVSRLALSFTVTDANGNTRPAGKRLLVNKTQAEALVKLTGSRLFADWPGARVTLFSTMAHNGKATVGIQAPPPLSPAPPQVAAEAHK